MMKTKKLLWSLPLLGLTTMLWGEDQLPKRETFAHYAPMLKHSPFAVASAAGPAGTTPDFAKDLYVANAAHSATIDFVTIASTVDKNLKEYLNTKETVDGYSISNIQWSDHVGETKVTISKDGQFATLTFNEALLTQAIQNPTAQMPQPQPGQGIAGRPPMNLPMPRPMGIPTIPTPPPHVRPVIRRKGGVEQQIRPQPRPQVQEAPDSDNGDEPDQ